MYIPRSTWGNNRSLVFIMLEMIWQRSVRQYTRTADTIIRCALARQVHVTAVIVFPPILSFSKLERAYVRE